MKNEITAYSNDFENVVLMIKQAQIRAYSSINRELIDLYFSVGKYISEKLSPLVRELSWTNNLIILSRTKSAGEREFYIQKTLKERYTKRELERQIDSNLYESFRENKLIISSGMQQIALARQKIVARKNKTHFG